MARGGHEVDAEPGQIEKRGGQHVQIRFTGIATGSRHLAQLERPAEKFFKMLAGMRAKIRDLALGVQVFLFGHGNGKVLGKGDEPALGDAFAGAAEDAAAHVDGFGRWVDGVLGTGGRTGCNNIVRCIGIYGRAAPITWQQFNVFLWIFGSFTPLFEPVFQHI